MTKMIQLTVLVMLAACVGGCGAVEKCKDPANANSVECTVVNSTIDCTKNEIPAVTTQFGPVVEKLIAEATGADGSVDWGHVESMLGSLGSAYGTCVLGSIIENYMASPPKLAAGEVKASVSTLKDGLNHARANLWKLDPSVKIHTAKGDL